MLGFLINLSWLVVGILFCINLSLTIYQQVKSIKELNKVDRLGSELKGKIESYPEMIADDLADKIEINIEGDYFSQHPFYKEDSLNDD